ncbi:MAG: phage tail tape measure protein, partial [Bacilli bacterium]|nr:phage tail tape measure protein [Bacilli bacterium]
MAGADRNFKITFDVDANIGPLKTAVGQIQGAFNKVNIPANFKKGIEDTLSKLTSEITNFESIASKGFNNLGDVSKANKSFEKITDLFSKLKIQAKDIQGIDLKKFLPAETVKKTKELGEAWVKVKEQVEKGVNSSTAEIKKQNQELDKQKDTLRDLQNALQALQTKNASLDKTKTGLTQDFTNAKKEIEVIVSKMRELEGQKGGKTSVEYKKLAGELREAQAEAKTINQQLLSLDNTIDKNNASIAEYGAKIKAAKGAIADIDGTIKALQASAQQMPEGFDKLRQELAELKGVDISKIPTDLNQIGDVIRTLNDEQLKQIKEDLLGFNTAAESTGPASETAAKGVQDLNVQVGNLSERQKDLEQFANRIKYFFSIGNTVMLFRRAIKSAIDTVKELDEVMTQAAVVTKFTVADMWAQLPQYAQRANELGVTIKGVYEASTLYYQQGLDTIEVIGVANETLKMAKIAGIDYATATDYMTSALRGFNMEVNELSAQKVNDIYSQLAAKTASNVEEISVAMSKTAPLAHNAGMEIETTAALLAQMIERTREAPETLGTAMKTVIARFQELKKDPALIEPVEGEIVDANKIETALRTIGVSLRDTSGQFRNLDEVFLEISEKWDGLSTNTQRYIATIAAGSRQQSRFIAMMADYKRTIDLVGLANNATGASAEQFGKTQDSLQSKLNRLKTAWEQFTMGLANNQAIKTVVDLLTNFINLINKITDGLSNKNGALKTLFDFGFLIGGIKLARAAFNGFFKWLTTTSVSTTKIVKDSLGNIIRTEEVVNAGKTYKSLFNNITASFSSVNKSFNLSSTATQLAVLSSQADDLNLKMSAMAANGEVNSEAYKKLEAELTKINAEMGLLRMQTLGKVESEFADAAAISGLTKEEVKRLAVLKENNYVTEKDIALMGPKIALEYAELMAQGKTTKALMKKLYAQKLEETLNKKGIVGLFANIGALILHKETVKFDTAAIKEKIKVQLAEIATTLKATAVTLTGAAAVALFAAAIAGVVWIIAQLIKTARDNTLENRIKAAGEAAKIAKESADDAKKAYDDLLNDKSGYDETQQALKDLTYGTQEWKEKLVEANQQVLELIQKMPELAAYLKKGEFGQLVIDSAGWDEVIQKQEDLYLTLTGASIEAQNRVRDLNMEQTAEDTGYNKYKKAYKEDFTNMESALLSGNGKEFEEISNSLGISEEELKKVRDAIIDYNTALETSKMANENAKTALFNSLLSPEKADKIGAEVVDNLSNAFVSNENIGKTFNTSNIIDDESHEAGAGWISKELQQRYAKEIKAAGGINNKTKLSALRSMYSAIAEIPIDEVEEKFGKNKKALKQAIADFANAAETKEAVDRITDNYLALEKADKEIVDILTSEGEGYYKGVEALVGNLTDAGEDFIKELTGKTSKELLDELIELGNKQQTAAIEALTSRKISVEDFGNGMDAGMLTGFSDHLIKIFESSGSQVAGNFGTKIQAIFNELNLKDPEKAKQFMTALNSIDWKKANEVDTLSNKLDELGITANDLGVKDIDGLEKEIIQLAKAAREVDLEKLTDQIRSLGQIAYDIGTGKQGRNFSEEQMNQLVDQGIAKKSDFVFDFESGDFKYLGGSMEDLRTAILANTAALNGEAKASLEKQIAQAQAAEGIVNQKDEFGYDISGNSLVKQFIETGQSDKTMEWFNNATSEEIVAYANEIKQLVSDLPRLLDEEIARQQNVAINDYITQYQNDLEGLAKIALSGDEEAAAALKVIADNAGVAEDAVNELSAAELAEITTVYQEAKAHDINTKELQEYANQLQYINNKLNKTQALQVALANTK